MRATGTALGAWGAKGEPSSAAQAHTSEKNVLTCVNHAWAVMLASGASSGTRRPSSGRPRRRTRSPSSMAYPTNSRPWEGKTPEQPATSGWRSSTKRQKWAMAETLERSVE